MGCIYIDRYEENHGTYDRVKLRSEQTCLTKRQLSYDMNGISQ